MVWSVISHECSLWIPSTGRCGADGNCPLDVAVDASTAARPGILNALGKLHSTLIHHMFYL